METRWAVVLVGVLSRIGGGEELVCPVNLLSPDRCVFFLRIPHTLFGPSMKESWLEVLRKDCANAVRMRSMTLNGKSFEVDYVEIMIWNELHIIAEMYPWADGNIWDRAFFVIGNSSVSNSNNGPEAQDRIRKLGANEDCAVFGFRRAKDDAATAIYKQGRREITTVSTTQRCHDWLLWAAEPVPHYYPCQASRKQVASTAGPLPLSAKPKDSSSSSSKPQDTGVKASSGDASPGADQFSEETYFVAFDQLRTPLEDSVLRLKSNIECKADAKVVDSQISVEIAGGSCAADLRVIGAAGTRASSIKRSFNMDDESISCCKSPQLSFVGVERDRLGWFFLCREFECEPPIWPIIVIVVLVILILGTVAGIGVFLYMTRDKKPGATPVAASTSVTPATPVTPRVASETSGVASLAGDETTDLDILTHAASPTATEAPKQ